MSKLDKDSVIEKFTNAYTASNGKAPEIEAKGGWYSVDGGKNMRLAQLDEMADEMSQAASAPAKKAAAPAKKAAAPAAKKVAADKPVAEKAAPAKKKPAAKKAKKAASAFSVKDFYIQQIQSANPGSRPPR
jgi:membrane protein involved in colicin uptake